MPAEGAPPAAAAAPKKRTRTVKVGARGPDGRPSAFHIEEDEPEAAAKPDHSKTIAELSALVGQLNRPRSVQRDSSGKATGLN